MILNSMSQWIEGNFCFDGYCDLDERGRPIDGTGPAYFIGAATGNERTPIVAIGVIQIEGGWLLFAQDPGAIHPQNADFCLATYGEVNDIFEVLAGDASGWEPDVIANALDRREGMRTHVIPDPQMDASAAKRALRRWVRSLDVTWPECDA